MIACIKKDTIKEVDKVQKDIQLGQVLNSVCYYPNKESAIEQGYVPLSFLTSIRSCYTNMIVEHNTAGNKKYYESLILNSEVPHRGYDLAMFMTSMGVSKCIPLSKLENNELMLKSQFLPVGIYNPDVGIFNPMIYCQVVFSDDTLESLQNALFEGYSLVSIKDMKSDGNLSKILSEIINIKEEN